MFDLSFPALSTPFPADAMPVVAHSTFDPALPFSLTLPDCNPAAAMSGEARPRIIGHFTALAEAMRGAIKMAEELEPDAAPRMLAILDRDERLVLAGAAANGAVAWCAPVMTATEARVEPPRIYRRVVCSTTKRPYRVSSGLHRTPPLLLRVGCIRWGREGGGCYTNRPI